jgi:nucleoside-diphosphate-sugar epimerase
MSLPPEGDLRHVLATTGSLWEPLRGSRIFLTGGSGFFGRWVLHALAAANSAYGLGVRVTALTRTPDAAVWAAPALGGWKELTLSCGDVRDFPAPAGQFDHVLHLATSPLPPSTPQEILDVLLAGTRRVLEFAARAGVQRFSVASSGTVYGPQPSGTTHASEDAFSGLNPLDTSSSNAEGKRAAEHLALVAGEAAGISVSVSRGFAFIGPGLPLDGQFAAGNFLRDALRGGPIVVDGDGTPVRSYLHAADLARWLWTIHLRGRHGRAYNVGSEDEISIRDLAERIAHAASPPTRVEIRRRPDPAAPAARYVPSTARARTELGLETTIPLDDAVRRTLAALRAPARC